MRRLGPPLFGARYCGNKDNKEVHDLNNEIGQCQVDGIITAGHSVPFQTLQEARKAGYSNRHDCVRDSTR